MVDVQADLPAVLGLLDLGHAGAHLSGEGTGVCGRCWGHHRHLGHHRGWHVHSAGGQALTDVAGPVCAGEEAEVLGQGGHAEGLVEQAAALVPVAERVPAWGAEEGERNAPLHVCRLLLWLFAEGRSWRKNFSRKVLAATQSDAFINGPQPTPTDTPP